jgi:hypothetical protein
MRKAGTQEGRSGPEALFPVFLPSLFEFNNWLICRTADTFRGSIKDFELPRVWEIGERSLLLRFGLFVVKSFHNR